MKRYVYSGPPSGATLRDGTSIRLLPGREVELPETDPYVATLVARGHLRAVAKAALTPQPAPEKARRRKR